MAASEREVADNPALLIDLYQLTMAAAYFAAGVTDTATFSFFVRRYPPDRGYLVAAGLDDVLRFLDGFSFTSDALQYLRRSGSYRDDFLDYLERLRFSGDVWARPEGSLCFVPEPLIEVTAPIIEAQLLETYLINQMNLQTMIATKAARCAHAAGGRHLVDFSLRRTHGSDAGMKVARASYIAGFAGSSNVLAEKCYGIPAFGTMAHSYVESFADEIDAFRAFVQLFPRNSTLLVDTYDTLSGVRKAAMVAAEMAARGQQLSGVRLDSGDLFELSRGARRILDATGLQHVKIFASGGLNEYTVADLVAKGAPIDAFGVGTDMGVSSDAPSLDCAYKLVEYAGQPRLKLSSGKETLAGRKQVWRARGAGGTMELDVVALRDEPVESIAAQIGMAAECVQPCLVPVMRHGRLVGTLPSLQSIRERFAAEFGRLPAPCKQLRNPSLYPVRLSQALQRQQAEAIAAVRVQLMK